MERIRNILKDERGQGMVEYGLIIMLVALVAFVAVAVLGNLILGNYNEISNGLPL
jgi:pilus assembly protein Flp/PilA